MSQYKSKMTSTSWFQCEKCLTNVLNKGVEIHSSDCPPSLDAVPSAVRYNFLKDNVLYGALDIKTNEDIKNLSSKEKDNLVFLSQSVIQLCGLAIGDWAVVQLLDNALRVPPVVKMVWPTVEKSLASVLFTKNGLELSFNQVGKYVMVSKVPSNIRLAKCISLVLLNGPKSLDITSELCNRISKAHTDNIFTIGNKISIMFFGKILKFEIKSVEATNTEMDIENHFCKLSIENQYEFYKTDCTTKWTIYRDQEQYKSNMCEDESLMIWGVDEELEEICELMNAVLGKLSYLVRSRSVLLYGNSGTGKTTLAKFLGKTSKANVVSINAPDLYSKFSGSAEETIKELFQDAKEHSPSVIILDQIDILCPLPSSRITDIEKRIVSTLLLMFNNLKKGDKIFIIATTNKPNNIDPVFRGCGRLDKEIEIPTPSPKSRRAILDGLLKNVPNNLNENQLQEVSTITHGFVGADLVSLCSSATLNASKRKDENLQLEDFKVALKTVRPSAMRDVEIKVPNVKLSDIGGQKNLKLILKQVVDWPLKRTESFLRLGITPPRGVLMFGPPGCGKTMIAKALATESGLNFLSIKGSEIFSKWVGESEKKVREVFRKARQVAPSIVFFDEIDAIGGERASDTSTDVEGRVLSQLLTELDGVSPRGNVIILAATNRLDRIDKALLRPGRLDRIVYVPLPDADTRRDIFRITLSTMPVLNVDIEHLVKITEHYSGAEINAVCREAAMKALEENLEAQHIESRHFEEALKLVTPRTPPSHRSNNPETTAGGFPLIFRCQNWVTLTAAIILVYGCAVYSQIQIVGV